MWILPKLTEWYVAMLGFLYLVAIDPTLSVLFIGGCGIAFKLEYILSTRE